MGQGGPGITLDNHCFDDNYVFTPSNQPLFNVSASDIHKAYRHITELGAEIVSGVVTYRDITEFSFKDPTAVHHGVHLLQLSGYNGGQACYICVIQNHPKKLPHARRLVSAGYRR
ncbi:hypothetical protein ACP26L_16060 [Paenibacillus sp. S-38]|uniref:hypothetical protein n=1 Tax=Paenibacillus sp. S-38 TaxID=3416710 RepID=UPI003CFA9304